VKKLLARMWHETDGVLSFEWTMLTSLLTVGVVSGVAAVRDAVTDEMGDVAQAMVSLDQSYTIQPPLAISVHTAGTSFGGSSFVGGIGLASGASDSVFVDASSYEDCARGRMKVVEFPRRNSQPDREAPPIAEDEARPAL
jgi:Flp pilus assembly pilin Flp